MTADAPPDRRALTFSQAEGLAPLPRPLRPKELSREGRAYLWAVLYDSLSKSFARRNYAPSNPYIGAPWDQILRAHWIRVQHNFLDDFDNDSVVWVRALKRIVTETRYHVVFDLIQFIMRHPSCPDGLEEAFSEALNVSRSAYIIEDKTVIPVATEQDAQSVHQAFADLAKTEYGGARMHLRQAGQSLSSGEWADSVREAIHAVESMVVSIDPDEKTLSNALVKLQRQGRINPNLKRAMNALYDYTSDEKGIRHAAVLQNADVDEADAIYMFGVCAAFLSFAVRRLAP